MPALDRQAYIENYIKSKIGSPVFALCTSEVPVVDQSIELTSIAFWSSFPIERSRTYDLGGGLGGCGCSTEETGDGLVSSFFPSNTDDVYFIGVLRVDESNFNAGGGLSASFDKKLLGTTVGAVPNDLAKRIQYETELDAWQGETRINYDDFEDKISFTFPSGLIQATAFYGFGVSPSETLTRIPARLLEVFAMMTTVNFLDTIISSRIAVSLQSDFGLDTSHFNEIASSLREKTDQMRMQYSDYPVSLG